MPVVFKSFDGGKIIFLEKFPSFLKQKALVRNIQGLLIQGK